MKKLAIDGGKPVNKDAWIPRTIFGNDELDAVKKVFYNSWETGVDFGFQGKYEQLFCQEFRKYLSDKGYVDAVSSGTAGIFVALQALELKQGSEVIVSPATNPGAVSPIILLGHKTKVVDSVKNSFLISPKKFEKAISKKTKAIIITHFGGLSCDLYPLLIIAKKHGIKVIEDCSQAHGALYDGQKVGTFGDIAVFSTMFSKTLAAGGSSGLIYTKSKKYFSSIRSYSDRGKHFDDKNFNGRDFHKYKYPALNFNSDELSCAIGLSVLSKLDSIVKKRFKIVKRLEQLLKKYSKAIFIRPIADNTYPSFFFLTLSIHSNLLKVTKKKFLQALQAEGVAINPHNNEIVSEWHWLKEKKTKNAIEYRNNSFNLLFHEKYNKKNVDDIISAIVKVESNYLK